LDTRPLGGAGEGVALVQPRRLALDTRSLSHPSLVVLWADPPSTERRLFRALVMRVFASTWLGVAALALSAVPWCRAVEDDARLDHGGDGELYCKTFKAGDAKLRLCEIEVEDYISRVSPWDRGSVGDGGLRGRGRRDYSTMSPGSAVGVTCGACSIALQNTRVAKMNMYLNNTGRIGVW
jgi:hypothetical protein